MANQPYISIIIPVFNEEQRIEKSLKTMLAFFRRDRIAYEVIVVNDGSHDQTAAVVTAFLKGNAIGKLIENDKNRGKGFSVRRGVLAARGQYIFFSDADLSTPIHEVRRFLPLLERKYEIVIGSRAVEGCNVVVRQRKYRELMGKTFNFFVRALVIDRILDTQCGFKGFRRSAAQDLFQRQKLDGFSFDVEILYLARRLGYTLREEPIEWHNSFESKVHAVKDSTRMFLDLLRIRFLHRHLQPRPASTLQPAAFQQSAGGQQQSSE